MAMTNAELESALGVLSQRLVQLPTRAQITALSDLLTEYQATTTQEILQLTQQITTLQGDIQDLKARVAELEGA